jgi:hypothetical protein
MVKMNTHKKAQSAEKVIYYGLFAIILTGIFFLFYHLVFSNANLKLAVPKRVESSIFTERFMNSPDCFTYQDSDSGIFYDSIIDWDRLTNDNLEKCYFIEDSYQQNIVAYVSAFRLRFGIPSLNLEKSVKTTNYDDNKAYTHRITRKARIYYNNQILIGEISVEVQTHVR